MLPLVTFFVMVLHKEELERLEKALGLPFKNGDLLSLVFVHPSYYHEHKDRLGGHYERLEFLGDSVLGLIVSQFLFEKLGSKIPEGELSRQKARLVSATSCARFAEKLDLLTYLRLGKSHRMLSEKSRQNTLADLFEALLGAIYLEGGWEVTSHFFHRHFGAEMEAILAEPESNWKAKFQELVQKKWQILPTYEVVEMLGPAHAPLFSLRVLLCGEEVGRGSGSSRQSAEQEAAKAACQTVEEGWSLPKKG